MVIQTKTFQESCKKILDAVDSSSPSIVTETLELKTLGGKELFLNVTNKEYFVTVRTELDEEDNLHAVVNAQLFLTLISKITTPTIELRVEGNTLVIRANGIYKIPLIFDGDALVTLPEIDIVNKTNTFFIKNSILQSILKYNSKEILKSGHISVIQKLFYIDDQGAITFTNGACVNHFTLDEKVVLTLTEKIVKLFKLFKSEQIEFTLGFDNLSNGTTVPKVRFRSEHATLTSILNMPEEFLQKFPVKAIRARVDDVYPHHIVIDRIRLLETINRLSLFLKEGTLLKPIYLNFKEDGVEVHTDVKDNYEVVDYVNRCESLAGSSYEAAFNTNDFKLTIETSEENYLNVSFGNSESILIQRNNVTNIIPESRM